MAIPAIALGSLKALDQERLIEGTRQLPSNDRPTGKTTIVIFEDDHGIRDLSTKF